MPITIDVATRTIRRANFDHHYTGDCFVNADSYDHDRRGPEQKAWCIHNAGYIVAIVFAEYYSYSDQDAMDEAANRGKLDFLQISESDLADYQTGTDSEGYPEYEGIINLGNASEPFDQENLDYFTVSVRLFSLDPVIMAVIETKSREEAVEVLQGVQCDKELDVDYPVGYHVLGNAVDYLRTDVLPISCASCHTAGYVVARHIQYTPAHAGQSCCEMTGSASHG